MVLGRITGVLKSNNLLSLRQTGFRLHLSAQDNLALLHQDLTRPRTSKTPKFLVAVDVKNAFDPVPHETVLHAAERRGFGGRTIRFIRSFLQDREYEVAVGDWTSPPYPNSIDVPQGSVLSPSLFNRVVTDLDNSLEKVHHLHYSIYADDVTIWTAGGGGRFVNR